MSNFKFLQSQESLIIEIFTAQLSGWLLSVYYLNTTLQYISPMLWWHDYDYVLTHLLKFPTLQMMCYKS